MPWPGDTQEQMRAKVSATRRLRVALVAAKLSLNNGIVGPRLMHVRRGFVIFILFRYSRSVHAMANWPLQKV